MVVNDSLDLAIRDVVRATIYIRLHDAHVRGYSRDLATAWDRLHPSKPLPENPHACMAAVYGDDRQRAWIARRGNRRNYLLGRIFTATMRQIEGGG